jgi:hypothetical protein
MTSKAKQPAIEAQDLTDFIQSLDEINDTASGYGALQSAVIKSDLGDMEVTATYADLPWNLTFEVKS